jgi:hypothetical protein
MLYFQIDFQDNSAINCITFQYKKSIPVNFDGTYTSIGNKYHRSGKLFLCRLLICPGTLLSIVYSTAVLCFLFQLVCASLFIWRICRSAFWSRWESISLM